MSLIYQRFERVCAARGDALALRALSEHVVRTFGELWVDVERTRVALRELALPARPTVVLAAGNCHGFIPTVVASLALDAAVLLLDADAVWSEVESIADRVAADAVIVREGTGPTNANTTALPCSLAAVVRPRRAAPPWRFPHETEGLILKSTSGSTRLPKCVVSTETNVIRDGEQLIHGLSLTPDDVTLAAVPLSHTYGLGTVVMPLLLQGTPVVMRDRFVPARLGDDVSDCGVTVMPGAPFIFDYLQRVGGQALGPLARMRLLITAGAPIGLDTLTVFKREAGLKIHSLYGTSETGGITFDASDDVGGDVHVGMPLSNSTVTLVEASGLRPGEGRILVQGPAVASRYAFSDPDDDAVSSFGASGFLSGDIGRHDDRGRLVLAGRVSQFVNVAGRKVQPQDVERVIATLAGVRQVNVFGAPCRTRGQMLIACVRRSDPDVTAASIRSHCASRLTPHKIPRQIVFADDWPTDARGKTDRRALEAFALAAAKEMDDI